MENEDKTIEELKELREGVDRDTINIGLVISDLFQTMTLAAIYLPEMNLSTEHMDLSFDGDTISVRIKGLSEGHSRKHVDEGFDEHNCYGCQSEEEEGMLYDEIR